MQLQNPEAIPHDLWPAGEALNLAAGDRLTLVLVGFDLRCEPARRASRELVVVAIDANDLPEAKPPKRKPRNRQKGTGLSEQRFTLRVVEQPADAVLRSLASQLERQLVVDPSLDSLVDRRISFEVEGVAIDTLFEAISKAAEVRIAVTPDRIVVRQGD